MSNQGVSDFVELILKQFKVNSEYMRIGDTIWPAPLGKHTVNQFQGAIDKISNAANFLSYGMIILDIGNVWTAHNNNTTLQRIEKTIIRSAAWYGGIELGKLGVTAGISTAHQHGRRSFTGHSNSHRR